MQIERLDVRAFGCLVDRSFTFAPGLTIVHGSNESGKSTLHAALYAALCGVRRGRGRSAAEHEFDRYRPWNETIWKVTVHVRLEDGRRIEIVQDLADKGRSRATDADLGGDRTAEILPREATPDASIWLGLDRRAFLATACVKQSDLGNVRDEPGHLREHLQRAAATSGADATAAEALARIDAFLKEQVGSRTVHSVKPLRRAIVRCEEAQRALTAARTRHTELEDLLAREDALVVARDDAQRALALGRAAAATRDAARLEHDLARARELHRRHPTGPPGLLAGHDLDREVERAVTAWDTRPAPSPLEGPDAHSLREELEERARELESLRGEARGLFEGDLRASGSPVAVRPVVLRAGVARGDAEEEAELSTGRAATRARDMRRLVEEHQRHRPADPGEPPGGGASSDDLRQMVAARTRTEPVVDPAIESRLNAFTRQLANARLRVRWGARSAFVATLVAGACLVSGYAQGSDSWRSAGGIWLVLAIAATVWWRRAAADVVQRMEALRPLEARLAELRTRYDDWQVEFDAAGAAARRWGIAPDDLPATLVAREAWDSARARRSVWMDVEARLRADVATADASLRNALQAMGVAVSNDPLADADRHERERMIEEEVVLLGERVARREREEATAQRGVQVEQECASALCAIAARLGLVATDALASRVELESWRRRRRTALLQHEAALREWHDLERLLDGGDLATLAARSQQATERAQALAQAFAPHEILEEIADTAEVARREETWREAVTEHDRLRVAIQLRERDFPAVAELEEAWREAEREVERVQRLEATLESTRDFLRRAQDRAHRDIAPVLAATVREALPAITNERYDDVRVDPETLAVMVHETGGEWRDAAVLSHGTSEQVYLLLRIAMARHLVRRGETSPLLLDDVTVHFDRERKEAVLHLLHAASDGRQIILWTQEADVVAWAERSLRPERDALVQLEIASDR